MLRPVHSVLLGVFTSIYLIGLHAAGGPPPLRDAEPLPLERAPELARRPVELIPKAVVTLPTCVSGAGQEHCQALGPTWGGELAALYRPTPYFAFGGGVAYGRATGSAADGPVAARTLALAMVARVYLLEDGPLDPYLEALVGWASEQTSSAARGRGDAETDAAFGPFARAGGGVDWVVGSGVKLGVLAGYSELVLPRGERCSAGSCTAGSAPGGSIGGGISAGVALSLRLGESL